jgi:dihydrofolate synthase/folylpolyglutamate synthase
VRVDGGPISEEEFVALVARLKPEVEAVNRKATYGQLTTFELLTALGFAFFKRKGAEFQVLEVGMGGRPSHPPPQAGSYPAPQYGQD